MLEMVRGKKNAWQFTVTDPLTGAPKNITGATITFTGKSDHDIPDASAEITGTVTITDGPNGIGKVVSDEADSSGLPNRRLEFWCELDIDDEPVFRDKLIMHPAVLTG